MHVLSFADWKDGQVCWGYREDDDHNVDLSGAVHRAHEIAPWRTEYDGSHNNQKGENGLRVGTVRPNTGRPIVWASRNIAMSMLVGIQLLTNSKKTRGGRLRRVNSETT